jgi:cytochrome c oxidase cbb3-type subunit 2
LRYGHYSLAAESKYDHPFQWGSKRTGPDLARVGGKYSNDWHTQHLTAPRSLVPQSVMPNYPWLVKTDLDYSDIQARMRALRVTGVPYSMSDAELKNNVKEFGEDVAKSLHIPDAEKNLVSQAETGNFDTHPEKLSEMDALVSYLQMLGTLVDFKKYDDDYFVQYR